MSVDPRFFRIVSGIRVVDLAAHLRATVSVGDTDQVVTGVAPLAVAGRGDVTFQSAGLTADSELAAGAIIITTADIAAQITEITLGKPTRNFWIWCRRVEWICEC